MSASSKAAVASSAAAVEASSSSRTPCCILNSSPSADKTICCRLSRFSDSGRSGDAVRVRVPIGLITLLLAGAPGAATIGMGGVAAPPATFRLVSILTGDSSSSMTGDAPPLKMSGDAEPVESGDLVPVLLTGDLDDRLSFIVCANNFCRSASSRSDAALASRSASSRMAAACAIAAASRAFNAASRSANARSRSCNSKSFSAKARAASLSAKVFSARRASSRSAASSSFSAAKDSNSASFSAAAASAARVFFDFFFFFRVEGAAVAPAPYPDEPQAVLAADFAFGDVDVRGAEYDPPWPYPDDEPLPATLCRKLLFALTRGFGSALPRCALPGTRREDGVPVSDATRGAPAAAFRLGALGTPGDEGPSPEKASLSGRTKRPCFGLHVKYRMPFTLPPCFPIGF